MSSILKISFIILFTIITSGCGNANSNEHAVENDAVPAAGTTIVAGRVIPKLSLELVDKNVVLHYSIKNQTEKVLSYTFPTSQRFDYIITSDTGEVVKKYSEGRFFTQNINTVKLKQGETLNFNPVVENLPRGTYVVTFWLTAKEEQFKTTTSFKIQ